MRRWKNVKAVEFSCFTLLTLEWSSKSIQEGVMGLCTSVFVKHTVPDGAMGEAAQWCGHFPMESHCVCAVPSGANSMGRGVWTSLVLENLPLYSEPHGWEGWGQTSFVFIHCPHHSSLIVASCHTFPWEATFDRCQTQSKGWIGFSVLSLI